MVFFFSRYHSWVWLGSYVWASANCLSLKGLSCCSWALWRRGHSACRGFWNIFTPSSVDLLVPCPNVLGQHLSLIGAWVISSGRYCQMSPSSPAAAGCQFLPVASPPLHWEYKPLLSLSPSFTLDAKVWTCPFWVQIPSLHRTFSCDLEFLVVY